jgi:hypothetical protein
METEVKKVDDIRKLRSTPALHWKMEARYMLLNEWLLRFSAIIDPHLPPLGSRSSQAYNLRGGSGYTVSNTPPLC